MTIENDLACDLAVFSTSERWAHLALGRRVLSAVTDVHETPDGFTFVFDADPDVERDVTTWIEGESRCCPFFRYRIERSRDGSTLVHVTGPATAKAILRAGLVELVRP